MKMIQIKLIKHFGILTVLAAGALLLNTGCTKNFKDVNTDKNSIPSVTPATLPFLFAHAQEVGTVNQANYQVAQNLFADQYAQYFGCEATYFGSDRLVINQSWVGANFNPYYTDVVPQLLTVFANTDTMSAEHAMAEVVWVLSLMKATDYFGPIPYFKAGTFATSVPYDAQDKIYADFFHRLDGAIAVLTPLAGTTSIFTSYDLFYQGNVSKWLKFANSLRLRLALRVSNVDPATAKTEAEASVASGVMTSSAPGSADDDCFVERSSTGGDINGLSTMSDWNEFRMSATMESVLKGYQDPRTAQFFLPAKNSGNATPLVWANYHGIRNGLSVAQQTIAQNVADANSHQGPNWSSTSTTVGGVIVGKTTYTSTPQNVMESAECYFLRAEAKLRNPSWNMGGTPQQLYEAGITNSMIQWGVTDNAAITAYIASPNTPVTPSSYGTTAAVSDVPIAWSADSVMELRQIMTQKWLALYPDGLEAWADYRRSHVLPLYTVVNSDNPLITNTSTQWLRRIPFLTSEKTSNTDAVNAAVSLLGGPDNELTPLWWDKN